MADVWRFLAALFAWPGLISAAVLSWFFLWLARKLTARFQGRQGPPFYQPFYDFLKLAGKRTVVPEGVSPALFYGLPLAAVISVAFALALLPLPLNPLRSFTGDLILVLYLLEMPAICTVLAGFVSRSVYGQVSASREAVLLLGYNLPFLAAVIALAVQAGSSRLADLSRIPYSPVHLFAAVAFLLAIPARLRTNPFSIPNAEQEIVAGALTEFNGLPLGLFELAHGMELTALTALFAVLFVPLGGASWAGLLIYLVVSLLLVFVLILLSVSTARVQINRAFRFFWLWGAGAAAASLVAAILW